MATLIYNTIKTYTCGWCGRKSINMKPDGMLHSHSRPGTANAECHGFATYMQGNRTK